MALDWIDLAERVGATERASTSPEANVPSTPEISFPRYQPSPEEVRAQQLEQVKAEE